MTREQLEKQKKIRKKKSVLLHLLTCYILVIENSFLVAVQGNIRSWVSRRWSHLKR